MAARKSLPDRIRQVADDCGHLTAALRETIKSLEWCHQWLDGNDAVAVAKDIAKAKKALHDHGGVEVD